MNANTVESLASVNALRNMIRSAGCVPNHRFYAALRAARQLEAELDKPMPEGRDYDVVCANGQTRTIFVPKGQNPTKVARENGYEITSFSPAKPKEVNA